MYMIGIDGGIGMKSRMGRGENTCIGIALYSVCDIIWDEDKDGLKSQWMI